HTLSLHDALPICLGNRGSENKYLDLDPETEKVRFYPATDEYKQLLEYMHRLYSEGLIDDKIYTMDNQKFQTKGMDGLYGSTMTRSEEHTSELQSRFDLVCRLLLEKKKKTYQ